MTIATYSLARPATVATPRGALLVGWLADIAIALRHNYRLARAAQATRRAAMRSARESAALHRWAHRLQDTEPHLAADLRAAADRHSEGF